MLKKTDKRHKIIYATIMLVGLSILVLDSLEVDIPSPSDLIVAFFDAVSPITRLK
ncbi:hypothetical protein U6B65_06905 [Oscillospiraceae bacterium MB08-C2-2]|nr:hypothetical protein U6B65_06905 [Oscillospiraceae bacterium MB08-C2-2]